MGTFHLSNLLNTFVHYIYHPTCFKTIVFDPVNGLSPPPPLSLHGNSKINPPRLISAPTSWYMYLHDLINSLYACSRHICSWTKVCFTLFKKKIPDKNILLTNKKWFNAWRNYSKLKKNVWKFSFCAWLTYGNLIQPLKLTASI